MAFEELKEDLLEAQDNVQSYLENSEDYIYLKSFKISMAFVTAFAQLLLVGALALLTLFILALAASFGIGLFLDNMYHGFLIVGAILLIVVFFVYLLRKKIDKPIIKKFSNSYFDKS